MPNPFRREPRHARRRRRGVESIEFALILPVFIGVLFSIIEFSWYMFQRNAVVDVARRACQQAASLDPDNDDFETAAAVAIVDELNAFGTGAGIDCNQPGANCVVNVTDLSASVPPRVVCNISVSYQQITNLVPVADDPADPGFMPFGLPSRMNGRASAVFEEGQ